MPDILTQGNIAFISLCICKIQRMSLRAKQPPRGCWLTETDKTLPLKSALRLFHITHSPTLQRSNILTSWQDCRNQHPGGTQPFTLRSTWIYDKATQKEEWWKMLRQHGPVWARIWQGWESMGLMIPCFKAHFYTHEQCETMKSN